MLSLDLRIQMLVLPCNILTLAHDTITMRWIRYVHYPIERDLLLQLEYVRFSRKNDARVTS